MLAIVAVRCCGNCGRPHCRCVHDIHDPDAFVHATINRSRIRMSPEEREELHAEGMAILVKLANDFKPRLGDHEQDGRFSGYAAMFLPRKLGDAWHRLHPEHRHETQDNGSRQWVIGDRAVSLEALTAEDPDRHAIMASNQSQLDLEGRLRRALIARSQAEHEWVVRVAKMTARGEQVATIASTLGLTEPMVGRYERMIARSLPEPRHQLQSFAELRAALKARAEVDAERAARVGHLLGQGATSSDVAGILEVDISEVHDHEESLRRVAHAIESEGE